MAFYNGIGSKPGYNFLNNILAKSKAPHKTLLNFRNKAHKIGFSQIQLDRLIAFSMSGLGKEDLIYTGKKMLDGTL